jgi:hypothetical protein
MSNRRRGPGTARKEAAVEEIKRVTRDVEVRVAEVADALSDLDRARALYKEGRKDDAFDFLIGILELHVRTIDLRSGIAVFSSVVARDGTVYPAGQSQLLCEQLHSEDLGPRPVRIVPKDPK